MRAEDILPQALELSEDERTRLAALLVDSVETGEELEGSWLDEITRRLDDHEQGITRALPADAVLAEAWARVKRARG